MNTTYPSDNLGCGKLKALGEHTDYLTEMLMFTASQMASTLQMALSLQYRGCWWGSRSGSLSERSHRITVDKNYLPEETINIKEKKHHVFLEHLLQHSYIHQ